MERPGGPTRHRGPLDHRPPPAHDDTIATPDRVAGLLLLLYAQRLSTSSTLTVSHVTTGNGQVTLRLGGAPTLLPDPLGTLVLNLIADRRPCTVIGH